MWTGRKTPYGRSEHAGRMRIPDPEEGYWEKMIITDLEVGYWEKMKITDPEEGYWKKREISDPEEGILNGKEPTDRKKGTGRRAKLHMGDRKDMQEECVIGNRTRGEHHF